MVLAVIIFTLHEIIQGPITIRRLSSILSCSHYQDKMVSEILPTCANFMDFIPKNDNKKYVHHIQASVHINRI